MVKIPAHITEATQQRMDAQKVIDAQQVKEWAKLQELTKRLKRDQAAWEASVVRCVAYGMSRRNIAAMAGISPGTVINIYKRVTGETEPTCG